MDRSATETALQKLRASTPPDGANGNDADGNGNGRRRLIRSPLSPPRRPETEQAGIREGALSSVALRRDTYFRRGLAVADVLAAVVALGVTVYGAGDRPRLAILAALPLLVFFSKLAGLYDRDEHLIRKTTLEEVPALLQAATMFTLLTLLLDNRLASDGFTKGQVVTLWVVLLVAMVLFRAVARRFVLVASTPERCLVLGDVGAAERVREKFRLSHSMRAELVGRVRMKGSPREKGGPPELGPVDDLDYILYSQRIERVIIGSSSRDTDDMLDAIRLVKALGVKVSVLPRLFEVVGSSVEFDDCDGITLLGVPHYGLTKSSEFLKRAFDVAGAVAGIVVMTPVAALIAAAIKLTSRGPVLFTQERIGRAGERFEMLKFRTMFDGADADREALSDLNVASGLFKIIDDPRVTRVGRVLRRCSLDELPQLLNVLRGEMSLVGPRPLVPEEDSRIEGWQRRRLDVTPGMTGVWQVLGSSPRIPLNDMVKVDYLYRTNWSLWLDIKILLRTVPLVVLRRGV